MLCINCGRFVYDIANVCSSKCKKELEAIYSKCPPEFNSGGEGGVPVEEGEERRKIEAEYITKELPF